MDKFATGPEQQSRKRSKKVGPACHVLRRIAQ